MKGRTMSAFEVSKTHIDALLTAGLDWNRYGPVRWFVNIRQHPDWDRAFEPGEPWGQTAMNVYRDCKRELTRETAGRVGAMLVNQNKRSVNFRYDEDELEAPYEFEPLPGAPNPLVILKAIGGYEYQACETPDWEETEAHA